MAERGKKPKIVKVDSEEITAVRAKAEVAQAEQKEETASKRVASAEENGAAASKKSTATAVKSGTSEAKGQATKFRVVAAILWLIAIGLEVGAILVLRKPPINTTLLIVLIVLDLIFAICGSLCWKKSNRYDPASEANKFKFFLWNNLGVIMAIIAFLPLVILIFANKDLDKKQKGIIGAIAIIAMAAVGATSFEYDPLSSEQVANDTSLVQQLTGSDRVYWTESGTHYHLYSECYTINKETTVQIYEGTVAEAYELKSIEALCKICSAKAEKENGKAPISADIVGELAEAAEQAVDDVA